MERFWSDPEGKTCKPTVAAWLEDADNWFDQETWRKGSS